MVGRKRLASRILRMAGLTVLAAVFALLVSNPAQAGQGGGQVQPASDNTTLWLVGGLVAVMVAAGIGLYFTRRSK